MIPKPSFQVLRSVPFTLNSSHSYRVVLRWHSALSYFVGATERGEPAEGLSSEAFPRRAPYFSQVRGGARRLTILVGGCTPNVAEPLFTAACHSLWTLGQRLSTNPKPSPSSPSFPKLSHLHGLEVRIVDEKLGL
jgi:hypothetical protein